MPPRYTASEDRLSVKDGSVVAIGKATFASRSWPLLRTIMHTLNRLRQTQTNKAIITYKMSISVIYDLDISQVKWYIVQEKNELLLWSVIVYLVTFASISPLWPE